MLKRHAVWLVCLSVCTVVGLGCKKPELAQAHGYEEGLGPESPKEKLDEERLAMALKGLTYSSGKLRVIVNRTGDRQKAVQTVAVAEKSLNTENTWFKAASLFRDAILADPTYAPGYEGIARSVLLEGNTKVADAALRTAVALDPKFSRAQFELGTVIQMTGDYANAIQVWKGLADRDPNYPDTFARLAIASYFDFEFKNAYHYLAEADKRKQNVPPQFRTLLKEVAPKP